MEKTVGPKAKERKPLQVLQPAGTDKNTLVGADRIFKSNKSKEIKSKQNSMGTVKKDVAKHKKVVKKNKAAQTEQKKNIKIKADDLMSDNPSENYWQILAEKRQMALVDTLEDNKKLVEHITKLKETNQIYKEMLDEMKTLTEVLLGKTDVN
ncbi:hypothetical protein PUN28_004525 [Cardiocondyla obscurior]|uniref:Geminin n=1 Tax=Cardiocondyla obscurior TaxID=286306 RepID=A0AAW2GDV9_9HYME